MADEAPTGDELDSLPEVIRSYFGAHDRRDADAATATFTCDARVHDDGTDYAGANQIHDWLAGASVAFSYTRHFLDAKSDGAGRWDVTNRLEGNFPGGVVDLHYRFALVDDLIAELTIEP
jgi:hypothetical protein